MKKKIIGIFVTILLLFSTAQAATLEYKYTSVLDAFLTKLETYQDNLAYVQLLDTFLTELNKLKPNYSSTGKVPAMIEYLVAGVDELKTKAFYKAIAGVFDPLESSSSGGGTSSSTSSSSSSSSGGSSSTSGSSSSSSGGSSSTSSTSTSGGSSGATFGPSDPSVVVEKSTGTCTGTAPSSTNAYYYIGGTSGTNFLVTPTYTRTKTNGVRNYPETLPYEKRSSTAAGLPCTYICANGYGGTLCDVSVSNAKLARNKYWKEVGPINSFSQISSACGTGWRVPTMDELCNNTIWRGGACYASDVSSVFKSGWYWTNTSITQSDASQYNVNASDYARAIHKDGELSIIPKNTSGLYVPCVLD